MKSIRPPNTERIFLPILLFILVFTFFWFLRWIGLLIAIPFTIIIHWSINSILGVRYWNKCLKEYRRLLNNNFSKKEALLKISQMVHPKLKLETHNEIVDKFSDIDLLVLFIGDSLPSNAKWDKHALEIKNKTSILYFRDGKYRQTIRKERVNELKGVAVTQSAEKDNILSYLKHRNLWASLKDYTQVHISEIFEGDFTSFKDFIEISETYNLVIHNYAELEKDFPELKELFCYFSVTLLRLGADLMQDYANRGIEEAQTDAIKSYETSIKLNLFQIPSYVALALIWGEGLDNCSKAVEYCNKGIQTFAKMENMEREKLSYYNQALLTDSSLIQNLKELKREFTKKKKERV